MKIDKQSFLKEMFNHYNFNIEQYIGYKIISKGHINTTYTLYFDLGNHVKRYLLQEINTNIFKNPRELMDNINKVTEFSKKTLKKTNRNSYKNKVLRICKTKDKKNYVILSDNSIWRIYHFIENSITFDTSKNPTIFFEAGKIIGEFQKTLSFFEPTELFETIKDFHNTPKRYNAFIESLNTAPNDKKEQCINEINFFINNTELPFFIQDLIDDKKIPVRVTHNDTKLNNLMFEYGSNKGLCLVDLDTVMPGCLCFDYGDFIRSACNNKTEDEKDVNSIIFQKDLCLEFTKGFLEKMKNISLIEVENLINGALTMIYECGMRFLTDFLNNNIYFKVSYPLHNLVRCKTQIHMYKQVLNCKDELEKEIMKIYKKITKSD